MANRTKPNDKVQGIAKAADIEYNEQSGAKKVLGPVLGKLSYIGTSTVQVNGYMGKLVAFFNNDTAVHFVNIGSGTLSAPTSPANGIPLPPQRYTILAMWTDNSFISDSANVHAYEVLDYSTVQ